MKKYTLKDKITFGIYKDSTIEYIVEENPKYLRWAICNVEGFSVDEQVIKLMNKKIREINSAMNDYIATKQRNAGDEPEYNSYGLSYKQDF